MLVEAVNRQSIQHRHSQDDDLGCGRRPHGHCGGIGGGYERSSPEICHAGKSFVLIRHARGGAQPYIEGIGIGPGNEKETYFTYEELQRICLLAARQMEAVH
jgi:hypothetical protein